MNTQTYELIDAAIRHPHVSLLDVWGPKWRYWDPSVAVSENMRRRMWWIRELEERRARSEEDEGWNGLREGKQMRAEELMSREEMDGWWDAAKEDVKGCPAEGFDVVWTIS
jgi:hypothetical protein